MFLALRYQPGFGPLAVAYAAANIASAIPVTPGGLGVVEVTMVAITVGFGAPRPTAVLAVLGYRIVNYWLPLIPGAIAYLRLRLRRGGAAEHETRDTAAQLTIARANITRVATVFTVTRSSGELTGKWHNARPGMARRGSTSCSTQLLPR